MTDEEFLTWLGQSRPRVIILEADASVAGIETTFYMSTKGGYLTQAGETPSNENYRPIATIGVLFTESLPLTGSSRLATGAIEIDNTNGIRDAWRPYVWHNRPIRAWIGDPEWAREDFRLIFVGVCAGIAPNGQNKFNLKLRDKLELLNVALTDAKLGGSGPNADSLIPVCLGENHNVTALLRDDGTYQVHNGAMESSSPTGTVDIEGRSNGVPVELTVNASTGIITLTHSYYGTMTFSVKGDKTGGVYINTVAALITRVVKNYGLASNQFVDADLDLVNLAAFEVANPQPVGYYAAERVNILDVCQALADSVGAQLSMSRIGELRLLKIGEPASFGMDVHPKYMVEKALTPTSVTEPVGAIKLAFCKNWTVQPDLQTTIPAAHKDLFGKEWLTTTPPEPTVAALYRLDAEPKQENSLLLRKVEADVEAQRRLDFWSVPRHVYEFEGTPEMMMLELGQGVQVFHPRFGMTSGVNGQIVSLAPDWLNARVKVGFIV